MSGISFSYVFGSSIDHIILSLCLNSDSICTGSATGEIAIWKKNNQWEVGVICSLSEETSCIGLCIISSSSEILRLLGTSSLIISLYANSKLRAWDINDGKCISYSKDLFSEENNLQHITSTSNGNIIVTGKNEIFVVDIFKMNRIRYFNTENDVFDIKIYKEEIIAVDCNKLYIFDMNNDETTDGIIKNFDKNVHEPKLVYDGDLLIMSRYNELIIIHKSAAISLSETNYSILTVGSKVLYLDISNNKVFVMIYHHIYCYSKTDLIKYTINSSFIPKPKKHQINLSPKLYQVYNDLIFMTDQKNIFSYEITTEKTETYKFFLPENDFSILNSEEIITARNILISSELLYAIGTNTGRTIVLTVDSLSKLVYFYKKTEVTAIYLHKNSLIIGYINETLSFWNFEIQHGTVYYSFPEKTVEIWASYLTGIIPIEYSKRNIDYFNKESWTQSKNSWVGIGLGQCESGAISLISFETKEVLCYFQALMSPIIKASMYLNLEYLTVSCANGKIYIFNMIIQALEREISGDSVINFDNIEVANENMLKTIDKSERIISSLEFYFVENSKKAIEVKIITIGKSSFPSLNINLAKLIKAKQPYPKTLLYSVGAIISSNLFKQGIFGVNKALSFKCDWVDSRYANSLRIASLISLGLDPPHLSPDTVSLIIYSLNPQFELRTKLFNHIELDPEVVEIAENLMFSNNNQLARTDRRAMTFAACSNFSVEKYHCQRIFLSLIDAMSISILACASISSKTLKNTKIIDFLIKMLKSGESRYILLACEMIKKIQGLLSDDLKDSQLEDIIKELLLYSCKDFKNVSKTFFYKVITCISMIRLPIFCKTLANEIKNNELDPNYQCAVARALEYFVKHHYLDSTTALNELGDLFLLAHSLKAFTENRDYSTIYLSTIRTLSSLLPMVKLTQEGRYLLIGLPTGLLNIYDLKSDKKWKSINVFGTTIFAIDTRESYIACYSLQENAIRILKIDQGYFGGILGQGDVKIIERIYLEEVEPLIANYHTMLKIMKIQWTGNKSLSLMRENKQEYIISVSKI